MYRDSSRRADSVPRVHSFLVPVLIIVSIGCVQVPTGASGERVERGLSLSEASSIDVRPRSVVLEPGQTRQFRAIVRDASGETIDSPVLWEARGGTITVDGLYTAGAAPGDYKIRASSGNVRAIARVSIPEGTGSPSSAQVVTLGAWGCSQVTQEWNGVRRLSPPFEIWTRFSWGGMALSNWYEDLSTRQKWSDFETLVEGGVSDVYAEICIRASDGFSEAAYERMATDVFREMRAIVGPDVRIWATGMADWEDEVCELAGPDGAEIAGRLADHVVSQGLAQRGPTPSPWRLDEIENDHCHPNDQGEDRAAKEILGFYLP